MSLVFFPDVHSLINYIFLHVWILLLINCSSINISILCSLSNDLEFEHLFCKKK
jgi:hypothetical protein